MMHSKPYLTKGFFTFAQNTNTVDYVKIAYLQAMSIKLTQKNNQYAIGVTPGQVIDDKYKQVFDYVIEIPWGDAAEKQSWKLSNEWKSIYMTPFDMTVKLDSDMLFFEDMESWWYIYSHCDLLPVTAICDYRLNSSDSLFYRPEIALYDLPNFYSALFYFRKCADNFRLFETVHYLFENWKNIGPDLFTNYSSKNLTTDIAFALACSILGLNFKHKEPTFVHMKKEIQDVQDAILQEQWTESLKYYFDKNMCLYIENYKQKYPVHYHVKGFATDQLIKKYELALGI